MMTVGDIRAAVTVVRSIREDWAYDAVENAIARLADQGFDQADILAACVKIARDHSNRAPVTLELKAGPVIAAAHPAKPAGGRAATYRRTDLNVLCDTCLKPEHTCQTSAANVGTNRDHDFISGREADRNRARAKHLTDHAGGMFELPEDV